ncbi:hypothetical protein HJD18_13905 [Thermoleophilia bacterium SCSIO 60948]|nr:hypothetical protein HJD18_13905 [Thermoleophilia bacterium SCSIO 60948]
MKRIATTVLAVVLALCVSAPADAGKPRKKPTKPGVTSYSWNPVTSEAGVSGSIDAVERCEPDRVVRAFAIIGGNSQPLDVTVSGVQGVWNVSGPVPSYPDAIKVKVERKRVGNTVCKRGVQTQAFSR